MTRPLRIGYLVPEFPGQSDIFFWREVKALERMGHEVRVLSTRMPQASAIARDWGPAAAARTRYLSRVDPVAAARGAAYLARRGLPLSTLLGGPRLAADLAVALAAAWRLAETATADDLAHVHVQSGGRAALIAALAARMDGPSYSLALHRPLTDDRAGQPIKWAEAAFATFATSALMAEAEDRLGAALPERRLVLPVGLDTGALQRDTPYSPVRHGRPMRLFACGDLVPESRHHDLVSAVRQLLDMGVDVRLEIAGEDPEGGSGFRRALEAHIKQLHLRDHVRLLGALDDAALRAQFLDADAMVLASGRAPLERGLMEAMAFGVPAIAVDAGGARDIIRDGRTGILVPPDNPGALARAIRDFAGQPDYACRLAAAGREQVETQFALDRCAAQLVGEIARTVDAR